MKAINILAVVLMAIAGSAWAADFSWLQSLKSSDIRLTAEVKDPVPSYEGEYGPDENTPLIRAYINASEANKGEVKEFLRAQGVETSIAYMLNDKGMADLRVRVGVYCKVSVSAEYGADANSRKLRAFASTSAKQKTLINWMIANKIVKDSSPRIVIFELARAFADQRAKAVKDLIEDAGK